MNLRPAYRVLSILSTLKAAQKGPQELGKNYVRRKGHAGLAGWFRWIFGR